MTNEAFTQVKFDQFLRDCDRKFTDARTVYFRYPLDDGGTANYRLFDCHGRALAVLEATSASLDQPTREALGQRGSGFLNLHLWDIGACDIRSPAEPRPEHSDRQVARRQDRLAVASALGKFQSPSRPCKIAAAIARLANVALDIEGRAHLPAPRPQVEICGDGTRPAVAL